MKNDLVSVIMPVYNGEKYLKESIESILNQDYKIFEFIIVNDGSTDNSLEIIQSYKDDRIILINQENKGVSKALNEGLKIAKGKYIARMDADDISYKNRLNLQVNFMQNNPEYILLGSNADYIEENGDFIFKYQANYYSDKQIKNQIKKECLFIHTSVFFLKESVLQEGMYPEKAHSFEDHLLWAKMTNQGKYKIFEESLVKYRFNPSSVTVDFKDYDNRFMDIKSKALNTGEITDEEEIILLNSLKKIDRNKKIISYHRLLAKKYLWNNYNPSKARKNIYISSKLDPFNVNNILLFVLSFLPESTINKIYKLKKI